MSLLPSSGSRFLFWNARGLLSNLSEFLPCLSRVRPSASFICESFLRSPHSLSVPGHISFRCDAPARNSGGFICLTPSSFSNFIRPLPLPPSSSHPLCTAFRVSLPSLDFTIVSVYLRPQGPFSEFDSLFSLISALPPPFLILGDFNAHHPTWGSATFCHRGLKVLDLADRLDVVILNSGAPTRLDPRTGHLSHLDLALASPCLAGRLHWEVLSDSLGSDHFPFVVSLACSPPLPQGPAPCRWILRRANWDHFEDCLTALASSVAPAVSDSLDSRYQLLCDMVISAANDSIPSRSPRPSSRPLVPWWSDSCASAIRSKRQAYRRLRVNSTPANLQHYRHCCALARRTVRDAKRNSWRAFCSRICRTTPISEIWSRINSINFNRARTSAILPGLSPTDKLSALRDHFSTLPLTCISPLEEEVSAAIRDLRYNTCTCASPLCLPFSRHELDAALSKHKDTAPGDDNIHAAFLRHLPAPAKDLLLDIFNSSFRESTVPFAWKSSIVVPILKHHQPCDRPSSFRPISLTSVPCKIMERILLTRLQWFLDSSGSICHAQNGFRKGRSCQLNHLILEADVRNAFNTKQHTIACFLDLHRAFDVVWHEGLLYKLLRLGFPLCYVKWIQAFLSNRTSQVRLGGLLSDTFILSSGTPQGSVLSPLLFTLMLNDLQDALPSGVKLSLYADDIAIWDSGRNLALLGSRIQAALDSLTDWADTWQMSFSASKSRAICFTRSRTHGMNFGLLLNGECIPAVKHTRFLGITFDSLLSWTPHIDSLLSTGQRIINIMRYISGQDWGADRNSLLLLYRALFRPHLDFSASILRTCSSSSLRRLRVLQATCLRIATGLPRSTPHDVLCVETGILPVSPHLDLTAAKFVLRVLNSAPDSPLGTLYCHWSPSLPAPSHPHPPCFLAAAGLLPTPVSPLIQPPAPTWMFSPPVTYLPPASPRTLVPALVLRANFLETLHLRFPHCTQVYTDGSYSPSSGFTSSSYWIPSSATSFSTRLPDHSGIFCAELFAIFSALRYIISHLISPSVIFTDSLSVLSALSHSHTSSVQRHLFFDTLACIHSAHCNGLLISFHWVPAHCGIAGNEEADRLAAAPASVSSYPFSPPFSFIRHSLHLSLLSRWQSSWDSSALSRDFFHMKSSVDPWPHLDFGPRIVSATLARLRTGHCKLNASLFRHGQASSPLCPHCPTAQTVQHFLIDCPFFERDRSLFLRPLLQSIPGSSLTPAYLLRGGSAPFSHYRTIFTAVINFVASSGLRP